MKHIFCILFIHITIVSAFAQDPHFTQFYANPLYTNPAMAGTAFFEETQAGRGVVKYRNQWPGLPGNRSTLCLGWDQPFDAVKGGFGALITSDVAGYGYLTTNSIMGNYAISFKTSPDTRLRWGIQAGIVSRSLDFSRISGDREIDPSLFSFPTSNSRPNDIVNFPDFNSGLLLTGKNYFIGLALFHLLEPNWSFYANPNDVLPRRVAVHCGYSFKISDLFSVTPMAQFQKQASATEFFGGALCRIGIIQTGLWYRQMLGFYRNADAIALNLGADLKNFRINYSYDHTVSDGRSAIPRSHEISIQYKWKTKQSREIESLALY